MQKLYYSISEMSELVDEEAHILRYWEKEFGHLKPKKNRGGNRTYSQKDLYIIKIIKKLLRDDKLSLKGAKEQFDKIISSGEDLQEIAESKTSYLLPSEAIRKQSQIVSSSDNGLNFKELIEMKKLLEEIYDFLKI